MADVAYITSQPGQSIYAFIKDRLGNVLTFTLSNGVYTYAATEAYNSAHWAQYAVQAIEREPGVYYLTQPQGLPNGSYPVIAWQQVAGGAYAPVSADGASGPLGGDVEIWIGNQYILEAVPGPPSDTQTSGYTYTYDAHGNLLAGVNVIVTLMSPGVPGVFSPRINAISDSNGLITVVLLKGATYTIRAEYGPAVTFTTGNDSQYQMPAIVSG